MTGTRIVKQAEKTKQDATDNIERKLNILEAWVNNGIPVIKTSTGHRLVDAKGRPMYDFFPRSLRQFKAWDASQNCESTRNALPQIRSTANDTLADRPTLEEKARAYMAALLKQAEEGARTHPDDQLSNLRTELKSVRAVLAVKMSEVRAERLKFIQLRRTHDGLVKKCEGDADEYKRVLSGLIQINEDLRSENSKLSRRIAKLLSSRRR